MGSLRKMSFDAVIVGGGGSGMRAALPVGAIRLQNSSYY